MSEHAPLPRGEPMLLQRSSELAEFRMAADLAGRGRGRCVLIEGPAGIGKTALLRAAYQSLPEQGWRVLTARGFALEADYSYGVVRQLFDPVRAVGGQAGWDRALDGAARLARRVFESAAVATVEDDVTYATMHGLYWLAANLAATTPLVIAVDDVHWVDSASLRWLAHLAGRLDGLPILLVLATRAGPARPAPGELEELRAVSGHALRPAPLDAEAAASLVRLRLGDAASAETCQACHGRTGGNPFLLNSLLDALSAAKENPADVVARLGPESVARAILHRIAQLADGSQALTQALAVLGRPVPLRRVAALTGQSLAGAAQLADGLRAANVLAAGAMLEFAHPIVRAAIYEAIPAGERGLRHAAAAWLLRDEGADAEQVALHLLRSEPQADPDVVAVLRAAAQAARGRGAPDVAVACIRRALDEPPEPATRSEVLLELGLSLALLLDATAAEVLREAIELMPDGPRRATAAVRIAGFLGIWAHHDSAAAICRLVLGASADNGQQAVIEAELVANEMISPASVRQAGRRLRSWAGSPYLCVQQRIVTAMSETSRGLPHRPVLAQINAVLDGGEFGLLQPDSLIASHVPMMLAWNGELKAAKRICESVQDAARARGSRNMLAHATSVHALISWRLGQLETAVADGRVAVEYIQRGAAPLAIAWSASFLVSALIELGRLDEAEESCEMALARQPPAGHMHTLMLQQAHGRLMLAQGRAADALDMLLSVGDGWTRLAVRNPALAGWRTDAVAAHLVLGSKRAAADLATENLELARVVNEPLVLASALRTAALLATGADSERMLAEAVTLVEPSPARLDLAHALADLGTLQRHAGRSSEARTPLSRALDLAQRCGAGPLVERARQELAAAGARPRRTSLTGPDALTSAERRVAGLAASGLSNRMIAQHLFITQTTVETHLRHVFQKLGIASRAALAEHLEPAAEAPDR